MSVHHPRDDEEARALHHLGVVGRALDDPPARDGDVAAAELAPAGVDEPVPEDEVGYAPANVATSAIAPVPISSSRTWRGNPSASRTGPRARATATSAT